MSEKTSEMRKAALEFAEQQAQFLFNRIREHQSDQFEANILISDDLNAVHDVLMGARLTKSLFYTRVKQECGYAKGKTKKLMLLKKWFEKVEPELYPYLTLPACFECITINTNDKSPRYKLAQAKTKLYISEVRARKINMDRQHLWSLCKKDSSCQRLEKKIRETDKRTSKNVHYLVERENFKARIIVPYAMQYSWVINTLKEITEKDLNLIK